MSFLNTIMLALQNLLVQYPGCKNGKLLEDDWSDPQTGFVPFILSFESFDLHTFRERETTTNVPATSSSWNLVIVENI